jgi:membrane protein DedA with SNARE-associated domain
MEGRTKETKTTLDLPALIETYGYAAVFVGAFLEGETILAMAGYACFQELMAFEKVVAIAAVAGFLGDQFFFFLGRVRGRQIMERFPQLKVRAQAFDTMLARYHAPLIVMIRFMYGFRIAGPIFLGMGRVSSLKFVVFNAIGAAIWAPLVAGAGYLFGHAIELFIRDSHRYQLAAFAVIAAAGIAGFWWHHRRK